MLSSVTVCPFCRDPYDDPCTFLLARLVVILGKEAGSAESRVTVLLPVER